MAKSKSLLLVLMLIAFFGDRALAQNQKPDSVLVVHTVVKGQNLYRISLAYGVSVAQIMAWNGIDNADYVKEGQQLNIWQYKVVPPKQKLQEKPQLPTTTTTNEPEIVSPPSSAEKEPQKTRVNLPFYPADSSQKNKNNGHDIVYTGTRIAPKEEEYDSTGLLDISGYISAYTSYYTDSVGSDEYQKFPTLSPHSNEVGINLIQVSAKYTSEKVRGVVTLQWGDMPEAAWSPRYNLVQQANLGVRIVPKLWFDIGYFRTHIGLESVQPRENINSTIAVTTFVEPYYLSGAKLTWQVSPKIALQANAFSQFNGFVENNRNKALGFSTVIDPTENLSMTLNTITTDDTPEGIKGKHQRWYNDFYLSWKTKRTVLGFEFNYGQQTNSGLTDTAATARIMSSLLALKYSIAKKLAIYGRGEFCKDPDGFMAGTYLNGQSKFVGIDIWGVTGGIELKPITNSYVRFEYRYLNQNQSSGDIFYWQGNYRTYRSEFIFSTGFWF